MMKNKNYENDLFTKFVQATERMYEQGISFDAMTWYINGDKLKKVAIAILRREQLFIMTRSIKPATLYGIRIEQDNMLGANIIELRGSDMVITLEIKYLIEREISNE